MSKPQPAAPAATPPGPKGGPPGPPAPGGGGSVDYRRLLRWSWYVVRLAFGVFLVGTALTLVVQTLGQYTLQLVGTITSTLTGQAGGGKGGGGYLNALVPQDLETAVILWIGLSVLLILLKLGNRLVQVYGDNIMSTRLQRQLHDRLLTFGPAYHQKHDVGTTQLIVSQFSVGSQPLFKDLIAFPLLRGIGLVTAVILLYGNLQQLGEAPAWIAGVMLAMILVMPVVTWFLAARVRRAYVLVREDQKDANEELLNSLSQPLEVQVLQAEQQRSSTFWGALRRLLRNRVRASMRNEFAAQFQTWAPEILQMIFVGYGAFYALSTGDLAAAGPIVAVYLLVPEAVRPLQEILQFFVGINMAWPQVQEVVTVLEKEPALQDRPDATDAPEGLVPLHLDGVTFSYTEGGRRILDAIDHTFEPGKVTAVVSRSGGGKSTLFNLLCRLQDPRGGAIRFGDRDIRDIRLASYRRRVTKVSQFPLLIMDTLRANFRLADADATDEEIRAVCERTGLWAELEKIDGHPPDVLDYELPRSWDQGPSGGQRRLLAITRALLTRPSVLLLDEPTTGVDALWRDRIVELVRELASEVTVLVVDHNVHEFIAEASDHVCVLEDGHFTQVGTPGDLARRPGLFRDLYLQGESEEARTQAGIPGEPAGAKPPAGPPGSPPGAGAAPGAPPGGPGGGKGPPAQPGPGMMEKKETP